MVALNRNLAVSKGIFMYYYVIYHIADISTCEQYGWHLFFNPSTPMIDLDRISLYNINTMLSRKVTRNT